MTSTTPSNSGEDRALIYNGRYELIRQIARGGTAQVYLARDLLLDRPVALKVLFPELSSDSSFVERFRREAQAAANLSHPNIVPVFDWGESERTYFIVMEYVDGEPLSSIVRSQAPLPAARAAGIAADIAKALSYAHRHGVIHRDVKPGNVLITRDGQVKVTDFGIARAVGADDNVTQTGLVMGTATYFSPEQAQGLGVDGRSDVYALGVVLYEMVTGRPPFSADTPVAIAYKHVSEPPVPPRSHEPRVPLDLEAIIMRAIAKQPSERYPTADDFYADLQRYAQGAPVLASSTHGGASVLATQALGGGGLAAAGVAGLGATQAFGATQALNGGVTTALPGGGAGAAGAGAGAGAAGTVPPGGRDEVALGDGRPPTTPPMPKRRWVGWTVAAIILATILALLVYASGRSLGYFGAPAYFHLPDEQGHPYSAASSELHNADGLVVHLRSAHSNDAKGTVIGQSPGPGVLVRKGDAVFLTYSLGARLVAVPPVLYDSVAVAKSKVQSAGLQVKTAPVLPSNINEQPGIVDHTSPAPNTLVLPHSTVTLYVVVGTYHKPVPATVNDTVNQAESALRAAQFQVGQVINQPSGTVKAGFVIGTNPPAGSSQPVQSPIEIIVSTGAPVSVPRVIGLTQGDAQRALIDAHLNYQVQYTTGSDVGFVVDQNPPSGTPEPKGFTVVITVVQAAPPTTTAPHPPPPPTTKPGKGNHVVSTTSSTSSTTTTQPLPPGRGHKKGNGGGANSQVLSY